MHRIWWERPFVTILDTEKQKVTRGWEAAWRHSFGKQPQAPGHVAAVSLWATQRTSLAFTSEHLSFSQAGLTDALVLSLLRAILCGPRELYQHKNLKSSQWPTPTVRVLSEAALEHPSQEGWRSSATQTMVSKLLWNLTFYPSNSGNLHFTISTLFF